METKRNNVIPWGTVRLKDEGGLPRFRTMQGCLTAHWLTIGPGAVRVGSVAVVVAGETEGRNGRSKGLFLRSSDLILNPWRWLLIGWVWLAVCGAPQVRGQSVVGSDTYLRLKAAIEAVPAIDTHDHLWPFERLPGLMETDHGRGMTLFGLWKSSYYPQVGSLTVRNPGEPFDSWWARAGRDFDNARATGFYRYQLPAFRDLYGVDFDRVTDEQAKVLDARIFDNYRDDRWVRQVVTERANIELMLNDPYWGRLDFRTYYPFEVLVFNVTTLLDGFHPSEFEQPSDDPYRFARGTRPRDRDARRLPRGPRPVVPRGQVQGRRLPQDDQGLRADPTVRGGPEGASRCASSGAPGASSRRRT